MAVLVLAIDTATPSMIAGVGLLKRPADLIAELADADPGAPPPDPITVLAQQTHTDAFGHAEHMMPLIQTAVQEAGYTLADLAAVVVGDGPGPFTGLRVGIATAAALADGLGIPAHGISSHDGRARGVDADDDFLIVTDARRREIYVTCYQADGTVLAGPEVLPPAQLPQWLTDRALKPAAIAGEGADLVSSVIAVSRRAPVRSLTYGLMSAAAPVLLTGAVPGPVEPRYLRRPDATPPTSVKSVLPQ